MTIRFALHLVTALLALGAVRGAEPGMAVRLPGEVLGKVDFLLVSIDSKRDTPAGDSPA